MKAKKDLFKAPATEVTNIVLDFISDVYDCAIDYDGKFHAEGIEGIIETLNAFSEWKMPTKLVKEIILGENLEKDIEEEIVNEVLKEYHKSLAA